MRVGTAIAVEGVRHEVVRFIGSGGEGDVWELAAVDGGPPLALKWFHPHTATPLRRAQLRELVARGAPNDRFLWPLGIVDSPADGRFGYVMPLRPSGFAGLADLLRGAVPRDEHAVARFAFELARCYRDLHLQGLCYRDINFGNAFVDPASGAALVCDNDNVGVEGVGRAQVLGAPRFMAPEIVRGEALPSKVTDRWSLAVLLFYLLVVHHPLEGGRTEVGLADAEADRRSYGTDPVFCFDPDDRSNRPVPGLHDHVPPLWASLPDRVRALFTRSFTTGLHDPRRRVVDSEWCDALASMRASLIVCDACGRAGHLTEEGAVPGCLVCGAEAGEVIALSSEVGHLVVRDGATLHGRRAGGGPDFTVTLGVVEEHPLRPGLLGLRNATTAPWTYRAADGSTHAVPPGRRAQLDVGATVDVAGTVWSVLRRPHVGSD